MRIYFFTTPVSTNSSPCCNISWLPQNCKLDLRICQHDEFSEAVSENWDVKWMTRPPGRAVVNQYLVLFRLFTFLVRRKAYCSLFYTVMNSISINLDSTIPFLPTFSINKFCDFIWENCTGFRQILMKQRICC